MDEQLRRTFAPGQPFGPPGTNDQAVINAMLTYAQTHRADLPVTCAIALEAAPRVREDSDG